MLNVAKLHIKLKGMKSKTICQQTLDIITPLSSWWGYEVNIEFVQYGIYFIGQELSMLTLKQRVSFTLLKHM